jgi:hypothetical protein
MSRKIFPGYRRLVGYNTDARMALQGLDEKRRLPGKSCLIFTAEVKREKHRFPLILTSV